MLLSYWSADAFISLAAICFSSATVPDRGHTTHTTEVDGAQAFLASTSHNSDHQVNHKGEGQMPRDTPEFEPIHWPMSGPARSVLDRHLQSSSEGATIRASILLDEVGKGLSEGFPAIELTHVIENYETMGWITTMQDETYGLIITNVAPLYFDQSDLLRGELLGRRYESDRRRTRLKKQRVQLSETIKALGLSADDEVTALHHALAKYGIGVFECVPDLAAGGYVAIVVHLKLGAKNRISAFGETEQKAIVNAAARAYLASQNNEP